MNNLAKGLIIGGVGVAAITISKLIKKASCDDNTYYRFYTTENLMTTLDFKIHSKELFENTKGIFIKDLESDDAEIRTKAKEAIESMERLVNRFNKDIADIQKELDRRNKK